MAHDRRRQVIAPVLAGALTPAGRPLSNEATFGAQSLAEAGRQLEHAAREANLDGAAGLAQAIRAECERARIDLGALMASLNSTETR